VKFVGKRKTQGEFNIFIRGMKRILGFFLVFCFLFSACKKQERKLFTKVAASTSGISFANELKDTPDLNILTYLYYYNGAGVAAADFNNDGLVDLFFTSNQGSDRLYLNKGNLRFQDVTESSNIQDLGTWSTGVSYADINADGLLDIYICKVGGYRALNGRNLLYVNQGIDANGIPVFKEDAAFYGLDFSGLSTQASFFDYDLDGDLDLFLMNHSVHPNRAYGKGSQRLQLDPRSGDRLYRNDQGKFIDISQEAGIFQGKIGYGLGLGISDINQDGYPDIYVGNDFFENDYLYLNQKDGTFKELISEDPTRLGHTSHFSMGNDIADINNDGLVDIVSVDMLPKDLETYKASGLDFPFPIYAYYLKNGYAPQYMQNTLHLNLGNATFSEIGYLSGISATEWSWGALIADYDNDGYKDIFISNGIKGATNDMDFVRFISNDAIQRGIDKGMSEKDMSLIDKIPEIKVPNYFYKNLGNLKFQDVTEDWSKSEDSFSNGCAYVDLDNDGDLDIVVNNVDDKAYILENKSASGNNYLKITFKGERGNGMGIGAKVTLFTPEMTLYEENFVTRGYLSSVPPILNFGLGKTEVVDSLTVVWPTGLSQTLKNIPVNQQITVSVQNAKQIAKKENRPSGFFRWKSIDSLINFVHKDQTSLEFSRNPLIPYANTNEGPQISVADINNDGKSDFFIGGAKRQPSGLFVQNDSGYFNQEQQPLFEEDAKSEDISQIFFNANEDQWEDLLVVSGGNEYKEGTQLRPRLYLNYEGKFQKDSLQFQNVEINASKVKAIDIDNDGDMDITISSDLVPWEYGKTPTQYIFKNNGLGSFTDITNEFAPEFKTIGNVKDFIWKDIDNNGFKDLIVVGHWMPVTIFLNTGKTLTLQSKNGLQKTHGWWNSISAVDFDLDGDLDLVAGNFGENSKLSASASQPITLYRQDFDNNGSTETLVTYFHAGRETIFASKDELAHQMPYLNKEYLSYKRFAKATLEDLFTKDKLDKAVKKRVYTLGCTYFENDGNGNFKAHKLPGLAQVSTVQDIAIENFNDDNYPDLILVGNNYEISTQIGRMDASHGVILLNDQMGGFIGDKVHSLNISGPARDLKKIKIKGINHYVITINNGAPIFLKKQSKKELQ